MKRLLQIEWLKLASYRTFYVFTIAYALLILGVYYGFDKLITIGILDLSVVYKFPNVWYYAAYVATWFAPVLCLLIINLVANEFSFKTLRQHIIDGLTREQVLYAKLFLAAALSIAGGLVAGLTGLIVGLIKSGAGTDGAIFQNIDYLLRLIWMTFGLQTAAILITLLVKRSALSILVFLGFMWIIEPLIGNIWLKDLYPYFPLNAFDNIVASPISIDPPSFGMHSTPIGVMIAAIIYPFIYIAASIYIIKKKDY
jgi:ABC-2 type transport system permease protein